MSLRVHMPRFGKDRLSPARCMSEGTFPMLMSALKSLGPPSRAHLPCGGKQGFWIASSLLSALSCAGFFLLWAAQASCCLSISLGYRSMVIFFYQRPLTPKRNQVRVIYKNQLNLGTVFPWKITKELNSSAFYIKNSKWCQFLKKVLNLNCEIAS